MTNLKTLTLPIGSMTDRLTLTQRQVNTLIAVYHDSGITSKNVSGYVHKATLTEREYYLLTQLGLNVTYDTLAEDEWSLAISSATLKDGNTATVSTVGSVELREVTLSIDSVAIALGTVTEEQAMALLTLSGNTLAFHANTAYGNHVADFTIKATPVWGGTAKTITVECQSITSAYSVFINPPSLKPQLDNDGGDRSLIEDYVGRCKCYLFNAAGTVKAEIREATFEGNYSGMTAGSVTLADGKQFGITYLNDRGVNWMVLRPEMHVYYNATDPVPAGKEGERMVNTGVYDVYGGKVFPKKYIGMFKAFSQNGTLKSQPNRIPTGNQTIQLFQNQAMNGGRDYGLWNYTDWCKENMLHLSYYSGTNYEVNVGEGRINNYNYVRNIVTGFTLPLAGKFQSGRVATVDSQGNSVNCLNFLGIEGMGEQIWEFVIGFRHDGTTAYVWDANAWSETREPDRTFPLVLTTTANGSFIEQVIAGAHLDMIPRAAGSRQSSATTGYCDGWYFNSSGRLLYVGGYAHDGSLCGLSASNAIYGFTAANVNIGARLAFYGEPETVDGSAFEAAIM